MPPRGCVSVSRNRVLFLSRLFSPFQIELASKIREICDIDYQVLFSTFHSQSRSQPHWETFEADKKLYRCCPEHVVPTEWLKAEIAAFKPSIVICGQVIGELFDAVLQTQQDLDYKLGFWLENPDLRRSLVHRAKAGAGFRLHLAAADFIFAIGPDSERFYQRMAPKIPVFLVPYGQDLSKCFAIDGSERSREKTHFLFSGQLRFHHNIKLITEAIEAVFRERPGEFVFTFSGHGPDEHLIQELLERNHQLRGVIRFDREFSTWEQRLLPFARAHVLILPSAYTGWGLVIPEGMSAGLCVITTKNAGASSFYIRHRTSGVVIKPTRKSLIQEMIRAIDNSDEVAEIGRQARNDALEGDASAVAVRFGRSVVNVSRTPKRRTTSIMSLLRVGHRLIGRR